MTFQLTCIREERRADSRLLAQHLGNKHRPTMVLIERYASQLEQFGKVIFQRTPSNESRTGQRERFALLNEDQTFFLLTLSKNTPRVVDLKVSLVKAFSEARRAAEVRTLEYLPAYHELHDAIQKHMTGSSNARWAHTNANKELNRISGVQPGHRKEARVLQQSVLAVACTVAARALAGAPGEIKVHACIKAALQPLENALALSSSPETE